jgi:hypothetical protein
LGRTNPRVDRNQPRFEASDRSLPNGRVFRLQLLLVGLVAAGDRLLQGSLGPLVL